MYAPVFRQGLLGLGPQSGQGSSPAAVLLRQHLAGHKLVQGLNAHRVKADLLGRITILLRVSKGLR